MNPLGPGSRLGRFEITGVLGEGAMGIVFLARDPHIDRQVAVKTIRAQGGIGLSRPEAESRFLKEARLAGRLQHPNIVTIYEVGKDGDVFFIAMEYVEGEPLTRYLGSRGTFSLGERVEIVRQVAQALEHAHARGVVHRDIKPGNILLASEGKVKVADFGIGKLLTSGATDMTRTGQLIGSPAYMSPEQIRGEKLDGRSDLFSLGVVFYELLTGARPFPGDSITTLVYQILHTEPRDPLEVKSDLPPAARDVFARLLAKRPENRPAGAREFINEIRRIESRIRESEQTHRLVVPAPARTVPQPLTPEMEARDTLPAPPPSAAPPPSPSPHALSRLFGVAAILLALAALIWIWRSTSRQAVLPSVVSVTPASSAEASPAPQPAEPTAAPAESAAEPTPAAPATPGTLPTAGPAAAADAIVGAPRYATRPAGARVTRAPAVAEEPVAAAPTAVVAAVTIAAPAETAPHSQPDNVYRTRRFARFSVSPDQARVYVDGRYVGTADDWDDSGGGQDFEFSRQGSHRVRLELPGYRDLNLEVLVVPGAEDDTVEIGDELERVSRVAYPKLASVSEQTRGAVVFEVDPPEATVTQDGKPLGPAASFGASSPLRLAGPAVHDLVLSAPGRRSKTVRILVAPNAEDEVARVKEKLKPE
jgi:serine/threonine protein kinase